MKFELSKAGAFLIVRIGGELDHHYCDIIRNRIDPELMEPPIRNIVFDLTGLTFMDSSGIAVILKAYRRMQHLNGTLLVCHVPGQARRVLDAAGVGRLVRIQ